MTHRRFLDMPSPRRIAVVLLVLVTISGLSGCISLSDLYPSDTTDGVTRPGSGGSGGDDESADGPGDGAGGSNEADGTSRESSDDGTEDARAGTDIPILSGRGLSPGDQRLLRVTEEYWVQTPWFGVSSIIVMVKRPPAPSVIVVPSGSLLEETMRLVPRVLPELPGDHRRSRVRVSVSFHLGDVPPFVDAERYRNPEIY